jgi:hypothetical protein
MKDNEERVIETPYGTITLLPVTEEDLKEARESLLKLEGIETE